jgi:hypothetical protein
MLSPFGRKIVGIGLPKTGTSTLTKCFRDWGMSAARWERSYGDFVLGGKTLDLFHEVLPVYDTFADFPWAAIYVEIDKRCPHTKFILTLRNVDSWLDSVCAHFDPITHPETIGGAAFREWFFGYPYPYMNPDAYLRRFREHTDAVIAYFRGRNDLLVVSWDEGDGWNELAGFLGMRSPVTMFPQVNTREQLKQGDKKAATECKQYVYCYWSNTKRIIDDYANSPLFSIATLRCHTGDPVCVIDYSETDWGGFEEKLNVQIIKRNFFFRHADYPWLTDFQIHVLSRTFDVVDVFRNCQWTECVFVDSDIFWLDAVRNDLDVDVFNSHYGNNGCYCYSKNSEKASKYLDYVKDYTQKALVCEEIRHMIQTSVGYFNDEAVFNYVRGLYPELCNSSFFPYNGPIKDLLEAKSIGAYKNVHLVGSYLSEQIAPYRCLFPLVIEEMASLINNLPAFSSLSCLSMLCRNRTVPLADVLSSDLHLAFSNLYESTSRFRELL